MGIALTVHMTSSSKGAFTRSVFQTIFVSGTFDLFNVMCEQHHRVALNPFLNSPNNGLKNVIRKNSLRFNIFTLLQIVNITDGFLFPKTRIGNALNSTTVN